MASLWKQTRRSMADCGELLNRLDRPGLIVCVHDGNEHGIPAQGGLEILGIHAAMAVNFEDAHVEALIMLQLLEGAEHGVMFRGGGDEMPPARRMSSRQAKYGKVARFRSPAGENDFMCRSRREATRVFPARRRLRRGLGGPPRGCLRDSRSYRAAEGIIASKASVASGVVAL